MAMPSSSSSHDPTSLVQEIIDKFPELEALLSKVKNYVLAQTKNAPTDPNSVLCCCNTNQAQPNSSPSPDDTSPNSLDLFNWLEKLERGIMYMQRALSKLKDLEQHVSSQQTLQEHCTILKRILDNFPECGREANVLLTKEVPDMVCLVEGTLTDLRHEIYALQKQRDDTHSVDAGGTVPDMTFYAYSMVGEMQSKDIKNEIWGDSDFLHFYNGFLEVFDGLKIETKLCLLCFSVFPDEAVVNKRALVQWWIGEGFVDSQSGATSILRDIIAKGLIEPDLKNRRAVGFKMDPFIRLVIVEIADKRGFLTFNEMGVPAADLSRSNRACLVVREEESSRKQLTRGEHQEKLHTLFNVNDPYPHFKKEWFSKLKNLNVLCLGGWQGSTDQHIEIDDTEFLLALENMKYLKFVSLHGISGITELPDSICKLKNLLILDLKACHNLGALPKNIGALKNLTHLDVSECCHLDHMPKGLASLSQLQVLKGFFIGCSASNKSCGLKALASLKKLTTLSVITSVADFPTEKEVQILQHLEPLEKLSIRWVQKRCKKSTSADDTTAMAASPDPGENNRNLQKLELIGFTETTPPAWLTEGKLKPEKKLYITGGMLQSLHTEQGKEITWEVQVLRLQFLKELKVDWSEVQKSFPKLIYLEKIRCPRLTFFPCDENGVWLKQESESTIVDLGLTWSFRRRGTT